MEPTEYCVHYIVKFTNYLLFQRQVKKLQRFSHKVDVIASYSCNISIIQTPRSLQHFLNETLILKRRMYYPGASIPCTPLASQFIPCTPLASHFPLHALRVPGL